MRKPIKSILHRIAVFICAFGLVVSLTPFTVLAQERTETIRVGFYPVLGYQESYDDGTYSGFAYDYYLQMQKFTRWDYDFVEASYAECLQMLLKGEIDVMAGVSKTPAREELMLFSQHTVSNVQNKLYALESNNSLYYESFDTFDGSRIGAQTGMLTDSLEAYAQEHDFAITITNFASMDQMQEALQSGEIDMIYGSSIATDFDSKIVARMDKTPLYYVTNIDHPEIAKELDEALRKITDNNPDFYNQVSQKYMLSGANATATFTREEMEYIHSSTRVYMIVNPDWAPITWYDETTNTWNGIFIDIAKEIEAYSGLSFSFLTEESFNEIAATKPDAINHVVAILANDSRWAVKNHVMMSNQVLPSSVVMVTAKGNTNIDPQTIAIPENFYIGYIMQDALEGREVLTYPNVEECLTAVNNGHADATFISQLVSTYYLSKLEFSNLYATANTGYSENLAFAVNETSDAPLVSILDKSLMCIGSTKIDQITIQNSIAKQRFSITGLLYSHPLMSIGVIVGIVALAFFLFFMIHTSKQDQRRSEEEIQKDAETARARTEFFMMISHELRTPLNAIVGYLNLAKEEAQASKSETAFIDRSLSAAKQLTNISEDMLDYTRIAANAVDLKEDLYDLKEVVQSVDQNMALQATKKDIRYRFTVNEIEHEYVIGDKLRLSQIIQNIISNGIKFTDPKGLVEASISETETSEREIVLTFVCKDTGKGMSPEYLEKVCAPFEQSDRSYSRTHGGLGLGLYLTRFYVDAMHGTFEVESQLNEGTTVTVKIPFARPNSEQLEKQEIDCSHVRAAICGKNEEENQHIKELLGRLKIKADCFEEEARFVKRVRNRMGTDYAYGLCILDESVSNACISPIQDLRAGIKVFVMTGDLAYTEACKKDARISQVLYKPIFQSVLFDAVMNEFGQYHETESNDDLPDFAGMRAMVVEDNAINADILVRMLQKANVVCEVVENGRLAVEAFQKEVADPCSIIFMDIQMPELNGYEATKAIRALPEGKTIPIVAVSANAFPDDIARSIESGMNQHLSKPVKQKQIYQAIEDYCIKA